ncbi:hypothetical protein BKA65DRAFT_25761 [Rhexocercosporidium sp. MPI-PUGE-AT-0058]|nr:hypothetical protein BKA65DRAFT_25761 [Rhexocercosporidium sp. MPI-PUGE-AT-0058]
MKSSSSFPLFYIIRLGLYLPYHPPASPHPRPIPLPPITTPPSPSSFPRSPSRPFPPSIVDISLHPAFIPLPRRQVSSSHLSTRTDPTSHSAIQPFQRHRKSTITIRPNTRSRGRKGASLAPLPHPLLSKFLSHFGLTSGTTSTPYKFKFKFTLTRSLKALGIGSPRSRKGDQTVLGCPGSGKAWAFSPAIRYIQPGDASYISGD